MTQLLKKAFLLLSLMFMTEWPGGIQSAYAQSSSTEANAQSSAVKDSIHHLLTSIQERTKDEKLKQAIKEAKAGYSGSTISDHAALKLLAVDSLLVDAMQQDPQLIASYAEALTRLFRQLPPQKEHPRYANSLHYLARIYFITGQYAKALPIFQQEQAVREKIQGKGHVDYAKALHNLATLYYVTGQYGNTLALFEQALIILKKGSGEGHPLYANALNNLASVYYVMGQYDKTLPLFQQVLAIREKVLGKEHPDYANTVNSLAGLYSSMGQYDKALPLFDQALAISEKVLGKEHSQYSMCLVNLASLYKDMGRYEKALPLYQHAMAITEKTLGNEHPQHITLISNLADLYEKTGEYEKAIPLSLQAVAVREKALGKEHPQYAVSLHNLAYLYMTMKQPDKALPLYQQTIAIMEQALGKEHPLYAVNINNLGICYASLNNSELALPLLIKANLINLQHISRTYSTLSKYEKMKLMKAEAFKFDYLPSLVFSHNLTGPAAVRQLYQNELLLKGIVLKSQQEVLKSIRNSSDSTTLQLYDQWEANNRSTGRQLLLPIKKRAPYFDSLQQVTIRQEQELSRRSTAFHHQQQSEAITVKDIAQKLSGGQAAIEFVRFRLYSKKGTDSVLYAAMLLLPRDSIPHFIPLFEEKQIQRLLQPAAGFATSQQAIKKLYPGNREAGRNSKDSLYRLIWKPLEKYLEGVHSIYYAPTGLLHHIAFQALPADSKHLLIDKYQLNQVLSTRSLALPEEPVQQPRSASVWGNIEYNMENSLAISKTTARGPGVPDTSASSFNLYNWDTRTIRGGGIWKPLPFAKAEADSLKTVLQQAGIKPEITGGSSATEEAFKALSGKSPQVLHLATHGFFLPVKENREEGLTNSNAFTMQQNPMFRSGLVLAGGNSAWQGKDVVAGKEDGILTAYEIAQMDLNGTSLVVLSACETARGDVQGNEGVIGLQRALKMAGVKQMIVSLWQVSDKPTMQLMTSFYKNWLGGQSTREALRNAQLQMKEKYKHPYYWAAFVLVE